MSDAEKEWERFEKALKVLVSRNKPPRPGSDKLLTLAKCGFMAGFAAGQVTLATAIGEKASAESNASLDAAGACLKATLKGNQ